jgi:hypothetical protein
MMVNLKRAAALLIYVLLATVACFGQTAGNNKAPDSSIVKLEKMPELLEVRYALSALPPHLRDGATTYVLDPSHGYILNHKGTNGLSCIVVRTDWQFPNRPFRDDVIWPVCYDAEGSKTLLQDYIYAAELRAKGLDAKQVHDKVTERFGKPGYPNPKRAGLAYMLEPIMRTVGDVKVPEPVTMNLPHYMFYAPNVTDADIGGKPFSQYPFMLKMSPGRDDFIIMLAGEKEKSGIIEESKELLADLCAYKQYLCTTEVTRKQMPNH